jgi:diguanylate cyclase (GGDEF)-like protein
MSLALFDLDHFKNVNDQHGHFVGDVVLRSVGQVLKRAVAAPMEVTRFGGEEFAMIMPGSDLQTAVAIVDNTLRQLAAQPVQLSELSIPMTASAGVVDVLPTDTWDVAYIACDSLLLEAKTGGRNRYRSQKRAETDRVER